ARRGKAFGENVLSVRGEAARIHGPDIGYVDEARAPRHQLAAVMDRRNKIDVRRMQGRGVGIVEQEQIALAYSALELADDGLASFCRAGQMMKEANAAHQQGTVGLIERDHQIVALVGDGAARHMLERDHRLLDDAKQAMPDNRESDWIHCLSFHRFDPTHRNRSIRCDNRPSYRAACPEAQWL